MTSTISPVSLEKFDNFGDLLRFLRRRAGITQIELSIAVGYSHAQISRLEQNLRQPDIPTIEARFIEPLLLRDQPHAAARLIDLAAKVRYEDGPAPGECPYKGLNYFEEKDAALFFGREAVNANLVRRVLSLVDEAGGLRFLAIVGASGIGKSSITRAGLVHGLRSQKRSAKWQAVILTPTAEPIESLAVALTREGGSLAATASLMDDLRKDPRSLDLFIKQKLKQLHSERQVLVIDQFEEVFSSCRSEQDRSAFINNLLAAARTENGPTIVIVSMRADFYQHCSDYPRLREAIAHQQEYIGEMEQADLRRAIEEPARRQRWEIEPGLVDLIMSDLGNEPGALPLLSHALMETWERRKGRRLTLSGYAAAGGVRGAIAETAEMVFTDQLNREQQAIARRIFLRLTQPGDETMGTITSRRASLQELVHRPEDHDSTHAVISALADARLITTSEDSIRVAHEALIRNWPTLRNWLDENREGLRLHRKLAEATSEWVATNRESDLLYRGARLIQTREWAGSHGADLNAQEREFLQASNALSELEAAAMEAQRQRELETAQNLAQTQSKAAADLRRRAVYLTAALGAAALLAVMAVIFGQRANRNAIEANQNQARAQQQAGLAAARELAAAANNTLETDPQLSILLALESLKRADTNEAQNALHQGILAMHLINKFNAHDDDTFGIAVSPDGKRLATIGSDGRINIWSSDDLSSTPAPEPLLSLPIAANFYPALNAGSLTLSFSPDGTRLAAAAADHALIFNSETGELLQDLAGRNGDVYTLAFDPGGQRLATTHAGGQAMLWEVETGKRIQTITLPGTNNERALIAIFSPDGEQLATGEDDGSLRFWDLGQKPARQLMSLRLSEARARLPSPDPLTSITFSPNGKYLAAATCRLAGVWDFEQIQHDPSTGPLFTLRGHRSCITSLLYSPDGTHVLTGSGDGTAKVWDAVTGQELFKLTAGMSSMWSMAISPDGGLAFSGHDDGSLAVWDIGNKENHEWWEIQDVALARINADGTRIFTSNYLKGSMQLWKPSLTGIEAIQIIEKLDDPSEMFTQACNRSISLCARIGISLVVTLWNPETGEGGKQFPVQPTLTSNGHGDVVMDIDFNPDGTQIATAGFDSRAFVWDLADGKLVTSQLTHDGPVWNVEFSPDGNLIATGSGDGKARVWDAKTGRVLQVFPNHEDWVYDVDFSQDGRFLLTGSRDGTARIWDVASGAELLKVKGHGTAIMSVDFSPDGSRFATASEDNQAVVWDVLTGQPLLQFPGTDIQFMADGRRLIVITEPGIARGYYLDIQELIPLARSRLLRGFTTEECQKYLHVETCPAETGE